MSARVLTIYFACGAACGLAAGLLWRMVNRRAVAAGTKVFFGVWAGGLAARFATVAAAFFLLAGRGPEIALAFCAGLILAQTAAVALPPACAEGRDNAR